jgi:lipoprotein-anchoring transpeptidase ErfK/SrfK
LIGFLLVDLLTRHQTQELPIGQTPDVIAFDRELNRLYVASESNTVTAFAITNRQAVRRSLVKPGSGRSRPSKA